MDRSPTGGTPTGEHHPPWQDGGTKYGPATPGGYTRTIRVHSEGRAGGGLWDHEVGGGGESLVTQYQPLTEDGMKLSTVSRRSAEYVRSVPKLDPARLTPSELKVWGDLQAGHAVEWIAGHRQMRRTTVTRIMDRLKAGGL